MNGEDEGRGRSLAEQIADGGIAGGANFRQVAQGAAGQLGREDDGLGHGDAVVAIGVDGAGQQVIRGGGDEQLEAGDAGQLAQRQEREFFRSFQQRLEQVVNGTVEVLHAAAALG